jgi:hypothetical protein
MKNESTKPDHLVVLWTSGDREVALKMAFMYARNSKVKGWWKDVTLVIWGPSSKLLTTDRELQTRLAAMKDAGVKLRACKACADEYGISPELEKLDVVVEYMGKPLAEFLKDDRCRVLAV